MEKGFGGRDKAPAPAGRWCAASFPFPAPAAPGLPCPPRPASPAVWLLFAVTVPCPSPGVPAWRIPWSEEPGRLQFMGSQKVRYH